MRSHINETRLRRLQQLINRFPKDPGNRAAFCREHGLNEAQVGHWFTGVRSFGEKSARSVEDAVGLAPGYLDWDDSTIQSWWPALNPANQKAVADHAIALLSAQKNSKDGQDHQAAQAKTKKKGSAAKGPLVSNGD
jgi:hypothetical protein